MDPIYELFLKNFREDNFDDCKRLINQPEFDINYIYTQDELQTFPIESSTSSLYREDVLDRIG